ncbi:MAG: envelope stress response membrane protein PspC [Novosphingobium sp.]|nr:envelope stress response membrane protein PspC [Novosphingobium sp.]
MNSRRTKFYRNKQDAKLMGVCAGIADYTGIDSLWVRVIAVLLVFAGLGLLIPAYFIVGLLATERPLHLYGDVEEERFWQRVRQSPSRSARDVKASFREIDRRLGDIENFYVSSNPRLSREIDNLR